ncbi:MAG: cation:proton antiporter [Kiritimatiellae bacterium]|nr:cation:proton antiporter [Kiritimatiellia bacterium]
MRGRMAPAIFLAFCAATACAGESGKTAYLSIIPSARFILQVGVLVFAAKMGGCLFSRWRLPRLLGELAAGVVIGPHLLGGLAVPLFPGGLMSDAFDFFGAQSPVAGIVTISLLVFFFLTGLDTDIRHLRQAPKVSIAVSLGGSLLCFLFALAILVRGIGLNIAPSWHWLTPQALLVSTAVSVTSLGMLAKMLAESRRLESPAGTVALTSATADTAAGLFMFTVFSGMLAEAASGAALTVSLMFGMAIRTVIGVGLVFLCGFPIARFVNNLALRDKNFTSAFAVSAACLLIAGGVMGIMGLSVITGAYVMGLVFSTTDLRHEIRERLDFVSVVLIPACFTVAGMQIDPRVLGDPAVLIGALLFVAGTVLSKAAGCALPAFVSGLDALGYLRVSLATLPRGEISMSLLVAVMLMTPLPPALLLSAVLLVVLTCTAGPTLADRGFAKNGSGTRRPLSVTDTVKIAFRFPRHQAALLMTKRAVEIFEDDGFYAQRLNRYQILYRISRESQVIHLKSQEGEVVFECSERERPLVNAVMMELSSGLEQSLRELQKPFDDVLLRKNMQQSESVVDAAPAIAILKNRFTRGTLKPRLLATTKQGAISELVSLLYDNGLVMDRERAVQAVYEREQGLSTGLEFGVAIPHARTDAVARLVCAIGLKKEGLNFDAVDGCPTRIVVLVLAPDNAATPQLQLIAHLCRMLDERGRAALLACDTADDMLAMLTDGHGQRLGGAAKPLGNSRTVTNSVTASPLAVCLQWPSIALDFAPPDQRQALPLLLALCARAGAVSSADEIRAALQRLPAPKPEPFTEDAAVFSMETRHVYRAVMAIGISAAGVTCACGQVCRVCALVLYPPSAASEAQNIIAALRHSLSRQNMAKLLAAKSSKEARDLLLSPTQP